MLSKPLLAVTLGDPNGVGPEITAKALVHPAARAHADCLVVGNREVLESCRIYAPGLPSTIEIRSIEDARPAIAAGQIPVLDSQIATPPRTPGKLDPAAGAAAMSWVKLAADAAIAGTIDGLVTCPIHKECIYRAGYNCIGHTELLAELTNTTDYRMCLFTDRMRIVHITGHLSMRAALDAVSIERIVRSAQIGHDALQRIGIPSPQIAIAGLNPHAGEAGAFGREEIEIIAPAVHACQRAGLPCTGPYSPDTVFKRMYDGEFSMVIAMYHDQGHIPLKLIAMDEGVNVTLGIPIVRTSVDHGTAFDIAGTGTAREFSLLAAIELAAKLASKDAIVRC